MQIKQNGIFRCAYPLPFALGIQTGAPDLPIDFLLHRGNDLVQLDQVQNGDQAAQGTHHPQFDSHLQGGAVHDEDADPEKDRLGANAEHCAPYPRPRIGREAEKCQNPVIEHGWNQRQGEYLQKDAAVAADPPAQIQLIPAENPCKKDDPQKYGHHSPQHRRLLPDQQIAVCDEGKQEKISHVCRREKPFHEIPPSVVWFYDSTISGCCQEMGGFTNSFPLLFVGSFFIFPVLYFVFTNRFLLYFPDTKCKYKS